jgi:hypothetical protein
VLPFPVELLRFLERSTPAEPADTRAATLDISTLEAGADPDADEDVAADAATAPEPTSAISTPA